MVLSFLERDLHLNCCKAEKSDVSLVFLSGETLVERLLLEVDMPKIERRLELLKDLALEEAFRLCFV
jgi:hypothetical protein